MKKIIKLQATWCGPCKALTVVLNNMTIPYEMEVIDIDKDPIKAATYKVKSVPTMLLIDESGAEVKRVVGLQTEKQLKEFFGTV